MPQCFEILLRVPVHAVSGQCTPKTVQQILHNTKHLHQILSGLDYFSLQRHKEIQTPKNFYSPTEGLHCPSEATESDIFLKK